MQGLARSYPAPARPAADRAAGLDADVAFLAAYGWPAPTLRAAARRGERSGTGAVEELIALGLDPALYWPALADDLGLGFLRDLDDATLVSNAGLLTTEAVRAAACALVAIGGRTLLVLAPRRDEIVVLRRRLAAAPALADRIRIAAPETIRALIAGRRHSVLTHYAINRLKRVLPDLSAARAAGESIAGHRHLAAALLAAALVAPSSTFAALGLLGTLFFLNCSYWKLAAAFRRRAPFRVEPLSDERLPTYSVLVPLYREAAVVGDLVAHLNRLDYPRARLEILLLVEADDIETRRAAARFATGRPFQTIVVPPGGPRTKPKALTYALSFARGDIVVVFDAEDRPETDQLRRAAAAFAERPDLGCVQARLAPDNEGSWLARMFIVEYAANFEVLLPALADWDAPLPLGGTSNHFPRKVLEKVGAWDPYNVTEDADLGIRLARFGYRAATIWSRTYEEAPVTFRQWLPQRRRWIKGWMQTVALSLGRGISPGLRLPPREGFAVHGILTAGVVGLLLYPASLCVLAIATVAALNGHFPEGVSSRLLFAANVLNGTAVVIAAAVAAVRGLWAARMRHLILHVPLLPVYWALMSFAAWQALFQLWRQPYSWEKTTHGVARDRRTPKAGRRLL